MPSLTEKPWFIAVCIPVAILGTSTLVTFLMLGQISRSAGSTADAGHEQPAAKGHGAEGRSEVEKHDWSYEGTEGPEQWGEHSPGEIAAKGIRQSPIEIISKAAITSPGLGAIDFHYSDTEFTIKNNGHTIRVDCPDMSNTITIAGRNYGLLQFHFHARSEHQIDGESYPMELHFVHVLSGGVSESSDKSVAKLAVVGVLIEEGPPNPLIDKLWTKLPQAEDDNASFTGPGLNFDVLLPPDGQRSFFRYSGSLTTPPCTENVLWSVMEEPIYLSKEQIEAFTKLYKKNYRPAQKINQRSVLRYLDGQPSSIAPTPSPVAPVLPGLPGGIK